MRAEVLLTPALLCHKDTAQGTQSPIQGALSLWHKRASVSHVLISTNESTASRGLGPMRGEEWTSLVIVVPGELRYVVLNTPNWPPHWAGRVLSAELQQRYWKHSADNRQPPFREGVKKQI